MPFLIYIERLHVLTKRRTCTQHSVQQRKVIEEKKTIWPLGSLPMNTCLLNICLLNPLTKWIQKRKYLEKLWNQHGYSSTVEGKCLGVLFLFVFFFFFGGGSFLFCFVCFCFFFPFSFALFFSAFLLLCLFALLWFRSHFNFILSNNFGRLSVVK